jgi:hypothetical protein
MTLITVGGTTYNLHQLVRFVSHTGQREIGATSSVLNPEPIFGEFRFVELFFSDGARAELDEAQTRAFDAWLAERSQRLDLDMVEEAILGHVVVHDTDEGGDIILPPDDDPATAD